MKAKTAQLARLSSWWEINGHLSGSMNARRNPFRVLSIGEIFEGNRRLEDWRAFANYSIKFTGIEPTADRVCAARHRFPNHEWVHLALLDVVDYYDADERWELILVGSDVDPRVIDFAFERAVLWVAVEGVDDGSKRRPW